MNELLRDGSVFMIPLRDQGFGVGVLARSNGKGLCFGYFFGPRIKFSSDIDIQSLIAEEALLSGKFGDLELVNGKWNLIGYISNWDKKRWDMNPMARVDEQAGKAWISVYDDDFNCIEESEISMEDAKKYPYDRMMGAGSVEIRLTNLLSDLQ